MRDHPSGILVATGEDCLFECIESAVTQHVPGFAVELISRTTRFEECIREAVLNRHSMVIMLPQTLATSDPFVGNHFECGIQAVKEIKSRSDAYVIVLATLDQWFQPLLAAGADAAMPLPFKFEDLGRQVRVGLGVDSHS